MYALENAPEDSWRPFEVPKRYRQLLGVVLNNARTSRADTLGNSQIKVERCISCILSRCFH
jgi:hypothetical protein